MIKQSILDKRRSIPFVDLSHKLKSFAVTQVDSTERKRNSDPVDLSSIEQGTGNKFCYCLTPWGSTIELITYPTPQPYLKESKRRKWPV